jgi:hypothetical protein
MVNAGLNCGLCYCTIASQQMNVVDLVVMKRGSDNSLWDRSSNLERLDNPTVAYLTRHNSKSGRES